MCYDKFYTQSEKVLHCCLPVSGLQGPTGEQGDKGDEGEQGNRGRAGPPGWNVRHVKFIPHISCLNVLVDGHCVSGVLCMLLSFSFVCQFFFSQGIQGDKGLKGLKGFRGGKGIKVHLEHYITV